MSEITKQELAAFTEANTQNAQAMEKVALTLESFSKQQEKIVERLYNGIGKEIVDNLGSQLENNGKKLDAINGSMSWIKLLLGLLGLAIFVAGVVLKALGI